MKTSDQEPRQADTSKGKIRRLLARFRAEHELALEALDKAAAGLIALKRQVPLSQIDHVFEKLDRLREDLRAIDPDTPPAPNEMKAIETRFYFLQINIEMLSAAALLAADSEANCQEATNQDLEAPTQTPNGPDCEPPMQSTRLSA